MTPDKLRRLADVAHQQGRLEAEKERLLAELATVEPARRAIRDIKPENVPAAADLRQLQVPGSEPAAAPPARLVQLLDIIHARLVAAPDGLTIAELVAATELKPKTVRATLSSLRKKNRAKALARGLWGAA